MPGLYRLSACTGHVLELQLTVGCGTPCLVMQTAPLFQPYVRGLLCALSLVTTAPLLAAIMKVYRSRYERSVVKDAIEGSMKYIGAGLVLVACLV